MTSQHNTGTHPFYIGMYIHICTHIYVHILTSQKECLCIFFCETSDFGTCFPSIFVCFLNTSKMVADECIRLQNMVGLICSTHQAKLVMAKRPSMETSKISEAADGRTSLRV